MNLYELPTDEPQEQPKADAMPFAPTASFGLNDGPNRLMLDSLAVAKSQIGVREEPMNSNSGPDVDVYLKSVNVPPGNAWCAAFTSWCIKTAGGTPKVDYPHTAWTPAIWQWADTEGMGIHPADVGAGTRDVPPGALFLLFGKVGEVERVKHVGFVDRIEAGIVHTVEGNTNKAGSREGGGVYRLERPIDTIYRFVRYGVSNEQ